MFAVFRILNSGTSTDILDDVGYMPEDSVRVYFRQFFIDIIEVYGYLFLNLFPTLSELDKIQDQFTDIGFPGCIGSVYCMKYK